MFFSKMPRELYKQGYFRKFQECTQLVMRSESPLTVGERELIAAFVSGVNSCRHCHGAHKRVAVAFGMDEGIFEDLMVDIESAQMPAKLKPILRYVKKLTEAPSKMTPQDAADVFDAGWDEQALHDAIMVCALFNYFNRIMDGHGIEPHFSHEAAASVPDGVSTDAYSYVPVDA